MKKAIAKAALTVGGTITGGALAYVAIDGPLAFGFVLGAAMVFGLLSFCSED